MALAPMRQIVQDATIVHGAIASHTLTTLHSCSVGVFVDGYNAIDEFNLVCQALERYVVNDSNLSSQSLTSLETTCAYAKPQEIDRELWEEFHGLRNGGLRVQEAAVSDQ
jgi:hypothetical protein